MSSLNKETLQVAMRAPDAGDPFDQEERVGGLDTLANKFGDVVPERLRGLSK